MRNRYLGLIGFLVIIALTSWVGAEGPLVSQDCVFRWEAPSTNADGTPLTDLNEYRLYTTRQKGVYDLTQPAAATIPAGTTQTTCRAANVTTDGQYYAIVTAVDQAGNQGNPSNEVSFVRDTTAPGVVERFEVLEFTGTMTIRRLPY